MQDVQHAHVHFWIRYSITNSIFLVTKFEGSLIWKADFPFKTRTPAYIKGYQRRFFQGSTDHRGIPGEPGCVVTLLPSHSDDIVWGVVYEIDITQHEFVKKHLDCREKNGYSLLSVAIFMPNHSLFHPSGLVYIANSDNSDYLGNLSAKAIAERILTAKGPSGTNLDYFVKLYMALKEITEHEDEHMIEIANEISRVLQVTSVEYL